MKNRRFMTAASRAGREPKAPALQQGLCAVVLILAGILAWLAAPLPARGEEDPNKLYNRGLDLAQQGKMAEAVDIWVRALDQVAEEYRPHVHKALGLAYKKLDQPAAAWHHVARYLQTAKGRDSEAGSWLADVEKELSKTHRKVVISCTPDGSTVHLAHSAVGPSYTCPLTWWFKPGPRPIHVAAAGHRPQSLTLEIRELGDRGIRDVKLQPLLESGLLEVVGKERRAQVFIDGMLEGVVPFKRKLKAGKYELMVGRPGIRPWKKTITLAAGGHIIEEPVLTPRTGSEPENGAASTDTAKPPPEDSTATSAREGTIEVEKPPDKTFDPLFWKWGLVGAGAALVAAGGILQAVSYSKNEGLHDKYPANPALPDYEHNKEQYEKGYEADVLPVSIAAYTLYGVGGAAAATGILFLLLDPGRPEGGSSSALSVRPISLPGGAGAQLNVRF